jgi:hypothetical protein
MTTTKPKPKPRKRERPKGLKFSPTSHRYWLDGKSVPGVTTILGVLDKPAIPKWAAKSVAEYVADNPAGVDELRSIGRDGLVKALADVPWGDRDRAANRGNEVHDLAERYLAGEIIDVPEELVGHVEAAADFIDAWGIDPVLSEAPVGSREHRYAGTLDLVADITAGPFAGTRAIVDWKTGRSGIYKEAAFQTTAYSFAEFTGLGGDERLMSDFHIEAAFGIHLRADGWDVYPLRFGEDVFQEFLVIREVYDINRRSAGDWKKPGSGYVGVALESASALFLKLGKEARW